MNAYVSKSWFIFITNSWIMTSCLYCGWGDRRLTLLLRKLDHVCKLLSFYKRKTSEISFNVFSRCLTTYFKESLVTCGCFCLFGRISCPPIVLFLSLCGPARARTHTYTHTHTGLSSAIYMRYGGGWASYETQSRCWVAWPDLTLLQDISSCTPIASC